MSEPREGPTGTSASGVSPRPPLPAFHTMTPVEARRAFDARSLRPRVLVPVLDVEDTSIDTTRGPLRARIYRGASQPAPLVVFFHGGGFVLGGIESHEWLCRRIASSVPATVLAVDYGLSPEHGFPTPLDDASAALAWADDRVEELGSRRGSIAVAGDSAGGNLAAAAAIRAREDGPAIASQYLAYPMLDSRMATDSHARYADGPTLTGDDLRWFWRHYLGAETEHPPHGASPSRCDDLSGLPPALIVTAELDPLRDEAEQYGERLVEHGTPCTVVRFAGLGHGFLGQGDDDPIAERALHQTLATLKALVAG